MPSSTIPWKAYSALWAQPSSAAGDSLPSATSRATDMAALIAAPRASSVVVISAYGAACAAVN